MKKSLLIALILLMNGCVGTIKIVKGTESDTKHSISPVVSKNNPTSVNKPDNKKFNLFED